MDNQRVIYNAVKNNDNSLNLISLVNKNNQKKRKQFSQFFALNLFLFQRE